MTGLLMDMDRMKSSAECKVNCWEDWRDFNQQSGAAMSAYEHLIPEQLFSTEAEPVEGVSAVKALAIASSQGQRIYTIDQNNLTTALAALTFNDDAVRQEIQTQVTAGFVVTIHQNELSYAGWSGVGYTVIDPETGAGAYKISGGSDGSVFTTGAVAATGVLSLIGIINTLALFGPSLGMAGLVTAAVSPYLILAVGMVAFVLGIAAALTGPDYSTESFDFIQDILAATQIFILLSLPLMVGGLGAIIGIIFLLAMLSRFLILNYL